MIRRGQVWWVELGRTTRMRARLSSSGAESFDAMKSTRATSTTVGVSPATRHTRRHPATRSCRSGQPPPRDSVANASANRKPKQGNLREALAGHRAEASHRESGRRNSVGFSTSIDESGRSARSAAHDAKKRGPELSPGPPTPSLLPRHAFGGVPFVVAGGVAGVGEAVDAPVMASFCLLPIVPRAFRVAWAFSTA